MSEIPKTYQPAAVEEKWYAQWLADGCFTADPHSPKPAYSIVIPPPNVTGVLTLGHVLNNTIQDILARRARMLGQEVLWLPGTDHAGIATQNVVERTLRKAGEMKHRDDLGREALVAKIWEWKEKYGGIIIRQLQKLGASCDWSRERFTMDEDYSRCVSRVFVDLYKKGLIYRGKRMVNWCPVSLTALSDEEVIMKPQNGMMYYFKLEVVGSATVPVAASGVSPDASNPGGEAADIEKSDAPRAGHKSSAGTPTTAGETPALPIFLTIATTRPETIPGDTALAVNPKDERYAHLIGQHVRRPLPVQMPDEQKLIPIIGDEHVEFEFGTGVLKVTPAHDKADFEIGQRHGLAVIDIMNPDGTMNALAGESLAGLDRFEARNVAVDHLRELGLLVKEEPYQNNVGYSERADVPIEPRLSEQWFLKYPSVEQARACVLQGSATVPVAASGVPRDASDISGAAANLEKSGAARLSSESSAGTPKTADGTPALPDPSAPMRFFPERWAKVYDHWLGGIQDWCISRQLWWGHRIPVWRRCFVGKEEVPKEVSAAFNNNTGFSIVSVSGVKDTFTAFDIADFDATSCTYEAVTYFEEEARMLEKLGFVQDPDVLDTWFSSWLWPFATMGWPEKTDTLAKFYPTTDLVTGPDIIFFWVARMIMAGFEWMGEMPFRNVYFTGIIRDKQGRKMSKSLGNSPDPLDLIAKYGADALRFGVMRSAPLGADILFDEKNVELGRNFCTKLWNAARFRQMQGGWTEGNPDNALMSSDDKWILIRLEAATLEVSRALDEYRFSDAASVLYRFFWSEFCDWYLEASKATLNSSDEARKTNTLIVIDTVLTVMLRLMHPFLPFITEELWHELGIAEGFSDDEGGQTIMQAPWPQPHGEYMETAYGIQAGDEKLAEAKYEVVNLGRALRRDAAIASNKRVRFVFQPSALLATHDAEVLRILLNAEPFEVLANYEAPRGTPTALTPLGELFLPLEGLIDVAAERERLQKEIAKVESELARVRAKLSNPNFSEKVPATVLEEHRQREAGWAEKLGQLTNMREALAG